MKTIIFLVFQFLTILIYAQEKDIIQGIIRDKDKNPIPYVSIVVKQNEKTISSYVSDLNGQYQIAVSDNLEKFTIVFSYIGMQTKEIEINRKNNEKQK